MDRDRISQLPDSILHRVLSFLKPKETARAACLSKSWLSVWFTYPNLTFNFYPDCLKRNQKMVNYVENTISRFSKSELSVHSVSLVVHSSPYGAYLSRFSVFSWFPSLIMTSIRFSVEKNVKILHVDCSEANRSYSLPDTIFGAKSLIELKLCSCDFNNLFPDTKLEFNNLKKVFFERVYVHDQWVLDNLFSNSQLIEEIVLCRCRLPLKKLRVSNVPKLKRFMMMHNDCAMVEIDAPSLELFDYSGDSTLNLDACPSLKRLGMRADHKTLKNISFSKFMYLEVLDFWKIDPWVDGLRLNISSQSLKQIWLEEPETEWEVMIDAPNLLQLHYRGYRLNYLYFKNIPKELRINLDMSGDVNESTSTWFLNFRKLLMELFNRTKIYLSLGVDEIQSCFEIQEDSEELPKPEVEHLTLNLFSRKIDHQALVDGLFWSCHPSYITVRWLGVKPDCKLSEYLWDNVMNRGGSILNCCHFQDTAFNYAKIQSFKGTGNACKTLVELMKAVEDGNAVCFKLKWSA